MQMDPRFQNQVAIVTGAGRGIGQACAFGLAREGARVALVSRTQSELEQTATEIKHLYPDSKTLIFTGDISDEGFVDSLFQKVSEAWQRIDILINNAGIARLSRVEKLELREWNEVMGVNATGVFLCSRAFFRHHRSTYQASGAIVNIGSLSGIRGVEKFPGFSAYVASKFAVVGLTEALSAEGRPLGIRVNCVAPGAVDTRMLRDAAPHLKAQATPEDIAKAVLFLSDKEQSGKLTGSVLEIFSNAN